jgi:hypothetical protein
MKTLKTIMLSAIIVAASSYYSSAAVSFSGTALNGTPGLAAGNYGVLLSLTAGTDWLSLTNVTIGTTFTTGATYTYGGSSFTAFRTNAATSFAGTASLTGTLSSISYSSFSNVANGQQFAYLILPNATAATGGVTNGTTLSLWRGANWLLPTDPPGGNFTFAASGGTFSQLTSASSSLNTWTVVPEPSTYALLAMSGIALAGYVIRRRRRA